MNNYVQAHSNTMQTVQEETEGFDVTKWGYSCLLLDSRVVLISTTEESGGSLSSWYQCFLVLDTENSIQNDNTGHISRAFKRLRAAYPVSAHSVEVYGFWGTKFSGESHEKTQITSTVEMLSTAWMCDAPLTKFWPRYVSRYRPSVWLQNAARDIQARIMSCWSVKYSNPSQDEV
jgi:hypothetical protein